MLVCVFIIEVKDVLLGDVDDDAFFVKPGLAEQLRELVLGQLFQVPSGYVDKEDELVVVADLVLKMFAVLEHELQLLGCDFLELEECST